MRRTRRIVGFMAAVAVVTGVAACGTADGEVAALRAELDDVIDERDALQARLDADVQRHDRTVEVVDAINAILDDPASHGSETEVVDLLASYARPEAQMRDDALGAVDLRTAWYATLYEDTLDAEIDVVHRWVAPDGSQSGGLWVWRGINQVGNPFELIGVQIDTHDDDGMVTDEWVIYPYPDDYVVEALEGEGTPVSDVWPD